MNSSRHDEIGTHFLKAQSLIGDERRHYIEAISARDPALAREVESLLAADEQEHAVFDKTENVGLARGTRLVSQEDMVGKQLGRYVVKRVIASGGMGTVYEAIQEKPRRTVALKMMKSGLATPAALRRFEIEAQILGQLQHPGIAQVFEANVYDNDAGGMPYFVMEYIPNALTITEFAQHNHLDLRGRLALFAPVCDAVHHGHQKGVIHRDLKPGNVLVDASGQTKVIDFGVARATDLDIQMTTMRTDVGQLIGTLAYMSPEQVAGDARAIDTRSDVYALGVVLYELLAGRMPQNLDRRSLVDAARIIQETDPPRLGSVNTAFRGDIDTIVAKALEKDKERRYQSAAEFAADIRRFLSDNPIMARPSSAAYQLRKFAKRNRGLVAGVVTAFLALLIGAVTAINYAIEAGKQAEVATMEAQRASRRFEQVRELARTFIFDFHDQIKDLPGSTSTREFLVKTGLKYLDDLSKEATDQPELLLEMSDAYERMGDVQGRPNYPNLGDLSGALESYQKSIKILEALCHANPDDLDLHRRLAFCHNRIKEVQTARGDLSQAIAHAHAYLNIVEPFYRKDPNDLPVQKLMAWGHNGLGKAYKLLGRLDEALVEFNKGMELREAIAAKSPDDKRWYRELSTGRIKIAEIYYLKCDYESAIEYFRRAHADRLVFAENQPNSRLAQRDLAFIYGKIGETFMEMNQLDDALANLEASQEIRLRLAEADPNNVSAKSDVAIGSYRLGEVQLKAGRLDKAMLHQQAFLSKSKELMAADSENTNYRSFVAEAHTRVGDVHLQKGDFGDAINEFQKGLVIIESIAENDPLNVSHQQQLASCLERLCSAQRNSGRADEGLENCQKCLAILESVLEREMSNPQSLFAVAEAHEQLGSTWNAMANDVGSSAEQSRTYQKQALAHFMRARKLTEQLQKESGPFPGTKELQDRCDAGIATCKHSIDSPR
ncbi:MAG: protein kinase [Planctomycetes bacterium]|nr:protein kinase [Planctomycetota bacterium]